MRYKVANKTADAFFCESANISIYLCMSVNKLYLDLNRITHVLQLRHSRSLENQVTSIRLYLDNSRFTYLLYDLDMKGPGNYVCIISFKIYLYTILEHIATMSTIVSQVDRIEIPNS